MYKKDTRNEEKYSSLQIITQLQGSSKLQQKKVQVKTSTTNQRVLQQVNNIITPWGGQRITS